MDSKTDKLEWCKNMEKSYSEWAVRTWKDLKREK